MAGSDYPMDTKFMTVSINEGASNLLKIAANLDTAKMKAPSFLMVLTAVGQYAYYRNDNVLVVPIGCLGL